MIEVEEAVAAAKRVKAIHYEVASMMMSDEAVEKLWKKNATNQYTSWLNLF